MHPTLRLRACVSPQLRLVSNPPAAALLPPPQVGIDQATGIVYNITGPEDMTLHELRRPRAAAAAALCNWRARARAGAPRRAWGPFTGSWAGPRMPPLALNPLPCARPRRAALPLVAPRPPSVLNLPPPPPQVNVAAEIIYDLVDPDANLIFGAVVDPSLQDEVGGGVWGGCG